MCFLSNLSFLGLPWSPTHSPPPPLPPPSQAPPMKKLPSPGQNGGDRQFSPPALVLSRNERPPLKGSAGRVLPNGRPGLPPTNYLEF